MPLYEYSCRRCESRFERVVFGSDEVRCPDCESADVSRLLSVFAVGSASAAGRREESPGGCGSCGDPRGPGSCASN